MNLQQSPTSTVEPIDMRNELETRLHGRWLFIAQAGWVALTLLVLALNAIAIPHADALLQAVCQSGTPCISGWTRWGVLVFVLDEVWYVFLSNAYLGQFTGMISLVFAVLILSLVALQVYRYRRVSTFGERQQTKWVIFGLALALGGFALFLIFQGLFLGPDLLSSSAAGVLLPTTVTDGLLLFIPISIAIAILRSRLYDIDTIINKALVYGLLTGILGGLYAGLIIGLTSLAGSITGQAALHPLVLVTSTLAIATLFQPVRRRIQSIIDRRFYRRKYDAVRTLAAFSATLRREVDLDQLREQLLAVVEETMQPTQVSLWLRNDQQRRKPNPDGTPKSPLSVEMRTL